MTDTIDWLFPGSIPTGPISGNPRLKAIAEKYKLKINYYPVDLASVYARTMGGIKLQLRSGRSGKTTGCWRCSDFAICWGC